MATNEQTPDFDADIDHLDPVVFPTNAEELTQFYRDMLLIRRFEERAGQLYGMGHIGGFCHLYIGQEAIITGVQSVLGEKYAPRYFPLIGSFETTSR